MQTFLPYADFEQSARCLDNKRLGKQRVECLQILNALYTGRGWVHHPATLMWRGYEQALVEYGLVICKTWIARGFNDTCYDKIGFYPVNAPRYPWWLGLSKLHDSHQSNLKRKNPKHYAHFDVPDDLPYWWPV